MPSEADTIGVTQFVPVFECGGTERQVLNLGLGLDERGFRVAFGCLRRSGRLLHEAEDRRLPVREYRMRSFYSARFLQQQVAFARQLARDRMQVMHAYNLWGNVFAIPAARLAGVPLVVAGIRDCGLYLTDWTRFVQRQVCRLADHVVVNAQRIKDWLVDDGYRADGITVIHNGLDLSRFLSDDGPDGGTLRGEFGVPENAPLISIISRMCPSKGFDDLIDAMPIVLARHPETRLLVVGEGLKSVDGTLRRDTTYQDALAARARALGVQDRVIFTGYRGDVPAIFRSVTLAVQPSRTEGLSNSVLEGMASGAAMVATPVGGTPEVMVHDRTGWLVPVQNPPALGHAICQLLSDPARRDRLGRAARAYARETHTIDRLVDRTTALYRDLLADTSRGRRARRWQRIAVATVARARRSPGPVPGGLRS
jgi:glycosyltransferase involved in cell wall biosynthesis